MDKGLEFRRQVFHLCLGVFVLLLILFNVVGVKVLLVVFFIGLFLSILSLKCKIPFICWFLDRFERRGSFPGKGALFFFLGCMLALVLFPRDVALASIAVLTFGDSLGPIIGICFGRRKSRLNDSRFVEGFVVAFFVSFFAALFFVPFIAALLGSFFALVFEFLEFRFWGYSFDDNLLVPLISGSVMFLAMML